MNRKLRRNLRTGHIVILHGGLGNQLFQWSFGIGLKETSKVEKLSFLSTRRTIAPAHTQFDLSRLLDSNKIDSFLNLDLEMNKYLRFLKDPLETRNPFNFNRKKILDTTNEPFKNPDVETDRKIFHGYYQNSTQVEIAAARTLPTLARSMEGVAVTSLERSIRGRTVVHVRRGDLLRGNHKNSLGILSDEFYSDLRNSISEAPVVLTDDVIEALRISKILGASEVYGPSTFNAFESLRIMSNAKLVVSANSTLSWWGGYLAISKGNSAIIPSPFFRDVKGLEIGTLHIKGSISLESNFLG